MLIVQDLIVLQDIVMTAEHTPGRLKEGAVQGTPEIYTHTWRRS